jgi:transposase-like protein
LAVIGGQVSPAQNARIYGVSAKIVSRWVTRFGSGGRQAMGDRSSRPTNSPRRTRQALADRIVELSRPASVRLALSAALYIAAPAMRNVGLPHRQKGKRVPGSGEAMGGAIFRWYVGVPASTLGQPAPSPVHTNPAVGGAFDETDAVQRCLVVAQRLRLLEIRPSRPQQIA